MPVNISETVESRLIYTNLDFMENVIVMSENNGHITCRSIQGMIEFGDYYFQS